MTIGNRPVFAAFAAGTLLVSACGYHAVYGAHDGERIGVVLARSDVGDAIASAEVVSGVRDELARDGVLARGDGYPRIEVEVLRADESSDGIAAVNGAPRARASDLGLLARAWIVTSKGAAHVRDTGDMRAFESVTSGDAPLADVFHHDDALRAAARSLGRRLASRVLGHPVSGDESGR